MKTLIYALCLLTSLSSIAQEKIGIDLDPSEDEKIRLVTVDRGDEVNVFFDYDEDEELAFIMIEYKPKHQFERPRTKKRYLSRLFYDRESHSVLYTADANRKDYICAEVTKVSIGFGFYKKALKLYESYCYINHKLNSDGTTSYYFNLVPYDSRI